MLYSQRMSITPSPSNVVTLFPSEQLVQTALENEKSENTRLSYASRMRILKGWFASQGQEVSPEGFARFIALKAQDGASPSTIAGFWNAYQDEVEVSPEDKGRIASVVRGLHRQARGYEPTQARALSSDEILAISLACPSNAGGLLDRTMILMGVSLGLRSSDLRSLRRTDVIPVHGQGFSIHVPYSKTDQTGVGVNLALPSLEPSLSAVDATVALTAWLRLLDLTDSQPALFRGTYKGRQTIRSQGLSARAVGDILINACVRAGMDTTGVSAHSLRASFATGAYGSGIEEKEIARTGRWSSVITQRGYDRATMWQAPAGSWLGMTLSQPASEAVVEASPTPL